MNKEVDNLEKVRPFLKFESPDDFYYLQILQRKKENPQLGSNSRAIKSYYIKSVEHLESRYEEIKDICRVFNARASIRLNKRSFEKVAFKALTNLANTMANKEHSFLKASYDRACGLGHNDTSKKWILDLDKEYKPKELADMFQVITDSAPQGGKVICMMPSKSGNHLITAPFDSRRFQMEYPEIEIHKDNPTNLFIP